MHGKLYDSDEKTVQGSSHISRTHGTAPSTYEPPLELSVKKIMSILKVDISYVESFLLFTYKFKYRLRQRGLETTSYNM